jgi:predicted nucleic acid-binding protein
MLLLDTNVVSELRRADQADAKVRRWASSVPAAQFYLSVITILEIEQGILRLERKDIGQAAMLRRWMDEQILQRFEERILPIDAPVALRCARLHVPNPRSDRDSLIAATALVHGMTIVTRNVKDFEGTGAPLLNPWLGKAKA